MIGSLESVLEQEINRLVEKRGSLRKRNMRRKMKGMWT
jgi:hypothetical protein